MRDAPNPWRGPGLASLLCFVLAAAAGAQHPAQHLLGGLATACCVQRLDGELWAAGPGYKARFDEHGVEFTPALGKLAPHNLPLALSMAAAGRAGRLTAIDPGTPQTEGMQVRYQRGLCIERYDVAAAGVALSFVFGRLPEGPGDLVVRMRLQTELPLAVADAHGLRFERAGIGGVSIGAVTGVDAASRRCAGTITLDGNELELRLPEQFVAHATLPLVLDPQIGPVLAVTNSTLDYGNPAVCTLGLSDSYCCAFERQFSAVDNDIRALRLDSSGAVTGSLLLVTNSPGTDDVGPSIGTIAGTASVASHCVVVYRRGVALMARSIAVNGTIGAESNLVVTTDSLLFPRVAGELTDADNDVICVYQNQTQGRIEAVQIQVNASGSLGAFAPVTLASDTLFSTVTTPRISHHGGLVGRYLVVYSSNVNGGTTSPRGIVVDRNLNVLASATLVSSTDDDDARDVDGDGTNWVVAYEHRLSNTSTDRDIHVVPALFDAVAGTLVPGTPAVVTNLLNTDELAPALGFLGGSYVVAWLRRAAPGSQNTDIFAKSIDPFTCAQCEPTILLANSADVETALAITTAPYTQFAVFEGYGIVLWERADVAVLNGDLEGIRYDSGDGVQSSAMFGCGSGGGVVASCAVRGNADFRVRLREAPAGLASWLVLSPHLTSIGCGPCTLRADPFNGFVAPMQVTDSHGNAAVPIAIPNSAAVVGVQVWAQWIVATPAGLCSYLGMDFSSHMYFVIE